MRDADRIAVKKLYISVDHEMGHDLPANLRTARILLCSQNSQTSTDTGMPCFPVFFLLDSTHKHDNIPLDSEKSSLFLRP